MSKASTVSAKDHDRLKIARPITFILCTGRCGSTLVSKISHLHPMVLSLSELFAMQEPDPFSRAICDGVQFWETLTRTNPALESFTRSGRYSEVLYKFHPGAMFNESNIPAIMKSTLPLLCDDPDALYSELAPVMKARPMMKLAEHYSALFEFLRVKLDRKYVCERSGGSIAYLDLLNEMFPGCRFVHLFRDGRDVALSMSKHPPIVLAAQSLNRAFNLGLDPIEGRIFSAARYGRAPALSVVYRAALGLNRSLASTRANGGIPGNTLDLSIYGKIWSKAIMAGQKAWLSLDEHRRLALRYEDILANPRLEIQRLFGFLCPGEDNTQWIEQAANLVKASSKSTWHALPKDVSARLTEACAPGLECLGYAA